MVFKFRVRSRVTIKWPRRFGVELCAVRLGLGVWQYEEEEYNRSGNETRDVAMRRMRATGAHAITRSKTTALYVGMCMAPNNGYGP